MNKIAKFLEFNGKSLIFLHRNGSYYIAIRPVCEALNINYNRQFQNIKSDPVLAPVFAVQQTQIPGDQKRRMIFLPEFYFYGWLFGVRSESKQLLEYKWECYRVLYEHFHGMASQRQKILKQQTAEEIEIKALEKRLSGNPDYQRLNEIKGNTLRRGKQLKQLDQHIISENLDLWSQDFVTEKLSN